MLNLTIIVIYESHFVSKEKQNLSFSFFKMYHLDKWYALDDFYQENIKESKTLRQVIIKIKKFK